jgi:hypothetical protein
MTIKSFISIKLMSTLTKTVPAQRAYLHNHAKLAFAG